MSLPVSIKEVPFFRLLIPFIVGISLQYWLSIFHFSWWNYFFLLLLLGLTFGCFLLASKWRFRWLFGIAINLFLIFCGIVVTVGQPTSDKLVTRSNNQVVLYLVDNPQMRVKSTRVQAEVRYVLSNGKWCATTENMLIYFDLKDSLATNLTYGSVIAANIVPQPIEQSGNPYQFDFKKYLSDRGIHYSSYLKPNTWIYTGYDGYGVKRKALQLRDKFVTMFSTFGLTGDELAVASALTLGYLDLIDDELRQVYSSSGAMHILSVSGLHVGILYVLLSFVLSFLDKRTFTRAIKAAILLMFLWFFALLTGLSPCVQRSVMMFSFVVMGDFFNRKSNIYNTLTASAFLLLLINPYNLQDIGFQLSYLAVIAIVFFYPYIYKLIFVKNWLLDKVWSLLAVSIAAQFGTFPICLYYFNQFPNYFLLGNLIAIPMSTIALYLSVLLIVVSPFPLLAAFIGKLFSLSVSLLNHGLEFVEKLPYSVYQGIHISALQMFAVFGLIVCLSIYLLSKRVRYLITGLILVVLFLGLNLNSYIRKAKTVEFIVFNINKKSLVGFRTNQQLAFVEVDTSKMQFAEKYNFFVKGYISSVGAIKSYEVVNPFLQNKNDLGSFITVQNRQGLSLLYFQGKTIAIPFERSLDKFVGKSRMVVDYLVINKFYPYRVLDFINPRMVIIDSSASKHAIEDVTLACKLQGIPFHITSTQGAFRLDCS
jgi:competence protein ComEC